MPATTGDRARHFPAIVRKHGGPIEAWIERVRDLGDVKYAEQLAFLREEHGFSQAHANAVVMYTRGSTTSKRVTTPDEYFDALDPVVAATCRAIFAAVTSKYPSLELVAAWNTPMLRHGTAYVMGVHAATRHILVNPFSEQVLATLGPRLAGYQVNKRTFKVPVDWKVDVALLRALAKARLAEIG